MAINGIPCPIVYTRHARTTTAAWASPFYECRVYLARTASRRWCHFAHTGRGYCALPACGTKKGLKSTCLGPNLTWPVIRLALANRPEMHRSGRELAGGSYAWSSSRSFHFENLEKREGGDTGASPGTRRRDAERVTRGNNGEHLASYPMAPARYGRLQVMICDIEGK